MIRRATLATSSLLIAALCFTSTAFAQRAGSRAGVLPDDNANTQNANDDASDNANNNRNAASNTRDRRTAQANTDNQPSGPRVLTPKDLNPDGGEIGTNFPPAFDPLNPPSNVRVNIDFDQAELGDVVRWISALTAQNFIIADTISSSKKITIISPQPVRIQDAYRAFISALNMNGLTVVPFGKFLKIVEAKNASKEPNPILERRGSISSDDRMVTYVHELEHVAIKDVQPVLDALKTDNANIVPYEATNTVIITETGSNLRRLLSMLDRLDTPSGRETIHIYQVKNAEADDLKEILTELFEDKGESGAPTPSRRNVRARSAAANTAQQQPNAADGTAPGAVSFSQIISDPRTNQLLIISTERSYQKMLEVVRQLDIPIPGEGEIHVVQLENANALDLAATLQSLAEGVDQQNQEASGGSRRGQQPSRNTASSMGSRRSGGETATLGGNVSVTADEATNSLVIVANLRDFIVLQRVIDQLDRRRDQVYVEAAILEVNLDRDNEFGLAFNGGALAEIAGENAPIFGATSLGGLSSLMMDPSSLMGLAVGLRGPEIEGSRQLLGIGLPSFGAILQAVQTDTDVNVLSTPHILTMDNEEAEIIVGENVPFVSGISSGYGLGGLGGSLGGLGGLGDLAGMSGLSGLGGLGSLGGLGGMLGSVNIQRQDVALTLRITPQINSSNYVRLEIEQQIDDIASDDPVRGPTTTTRQIRTTVAVEDQQTVVLGGLMRDTQTRTVNKVPFLGDIPVIGHLFRHTSSRTVKTNLLLLLTPYIIRDPSDFQEIFRRKMQEREEFMAYFGRHEADYERSIDYARKNGPAQAMLKTIQKATEREEQRARAFGAEASEQDISNSQENNPLRFDTSGLDETAPPSDVEEVDENAPDSDAEQPAVEPIDTSIMDTPEN